MNSDFLNFSSKFLNLSKNFSLTKSRRKKFAKAYNNVAPRDKLNVTIKTPNHLPKINPANSATGDPNPAANTQMMVNIINVIDKKNKFVFFNSEK